ncbi:MAG: heparinase II/III domain-containing protein [Gemmatimonadales bacterium]
MITAQGLDELRTRIEEDPDRSALLDTLALRVERLLESPPVVPRVKALLSRDGGRCPGDGTTLRFHPWRPDEHTCPRCGRSFGGDRHHRYWARAQHLWLAERLCDLSFLTALREDARAGRRALELLETYENLYFELPNRDNVLGPSHLFFSTYLESLWITSWMTAAFVLREAGALPEERADGVSRVAEEAATIIGEFGEGFSNRQTWHAAALTAIAAWFEDEELARSAVESRTGLLGHLTDGFGHDGLWWEGENYHLFALRGLMLGLDWANVLGINLLEDAELRAHFRSALLAPSVSALPDLTYPARRDARYGVSLAQPPFLEIWEVGRGRLGPDPELDAWLGALHVAQRPLPQADDYDAWLHDAGLERAPEPDRTRLSWWALAAMGDHLEEAPLWKPASALLADQGLAVLRHDGRYASLECGRAIGGHGHPDRLHLTVHAGGVHWLPDPGTGSYVVPELAWYRSALAHNAPLIDGRNADDEDAWCEAYDGAAEHAWCRARAGPIRRAIVAGPSGLVDLVEFDAGSERLLELPWHLQGEVTVTSPGRWDAALLEPQFLSDAERFIPEASGPIGIEARSGSSSLRLWISAPDAELFRVEAPGLPTAPARRPFLLFRARAATARWAAVVDWSEASEGRATGLRVEAEAIEVLRAGGRARYQWSATGVAIDDQGKRVTLGGARQEPKRRAPLFTEKTAPHHAVAVRIDEPPALDGTLGGFDTTEPLTLDDELQYRRSEEPYDPERLAARAWLNWDGESLYLAAQVDKPELVFRPADAPALELDNDPDDIHSDGLQVYLDLDGVQTGILMVPQQDGSLHARETGAERIVPVRGSWTPTETGYCVTVEIGAIPETLGPGSRIGFDLLINEMRPDRDRRAGQLVWSGGHGWVYLQGDSHDFARLGVVELG